MQLNTCAPALAVRRVLCSCKISGCNLQQLLVGSSDCGAACLLPRFNFALCSGGTFAVGGMPHANYKAGMSIAAAAQRIALAA